VHRWIYQQDYNVPLFLYSPEIVSFGEPCYVSLALTSGFTQITQSEFNAMVDEMYPIALQPQQPKTETLYEIANRLLDENHQLKMRVIELEHAERMRELTSKA
jgi:hypothetical protein